MKHVIGLLYGAYVWLVFSVLVVVSIGIAALVPGLVRRRRWIARCGRLSLFLAGIKTVVRGLEHIPETGCVVVANHASYVDAVVTQGFLPPRFAFVVKGEMRTAPFLGFMLRRVGARFVERFESSGSARDARQLLRAAASGESLVIFPEGTFVAAPGLREFRAGAFAAAVRGATPVVPAVVSGSRTVLPADRWLPRRANLRIDILPAISPTDACYGTSKNLAAETRRRILSILDEPDLAPPNGED